MLLFFFDLGVRKVVPVSLLFFDHGVRENFVGLPEIVLWIKKRWWSFVIVAPVRV